MTYHKGACLYEGKASTLYEAVDEHGAVCPSLCIIVRKNDITKLDGEVRDNIAGKGNYTNQFSNRMFRLLENECIPTHFVEELSPNETLIKYVTPLPLEVVVRNIAAGSLCRGLPIDPGVVFDKPIVDLHYKDDDLHDPLINADRAIHALKIVESEIELAEIEALARDINNTLKEFFADIGITLVDFKLEFGRKEDGMIVVIDEISPDTCRLWDAETGAKLDKDVFREGKGNDATIAAYKEAFERITADM